jgi:hypothetical protein
MDVEAMLLWPLDIGRYEFPVDALQFMPEDSIRMFHRAPDHLRFQFKAQVVEFVEFLEVQSRNGCPVLGLGVHQTLCGETLQRFPDRSSRDAEAQSQFSVQEWLSGRHLA